MKKSVLFLIATICCMTANAEVPTRKMLENGKMWAYVYHHIEYRDTPGNDGEYYEEKTWMSYYQLDGDTVIDGRQYMKMYRQDEVNYERTYYGAFREDEEGRVYMYNYNGDNQDYMVLDFTMQYDGGNTDVTRIAETINVDGQLYRRYRYQGIPANGVIGNIYRENIAVEGVGVPKRGMYFLPLMDEDYEELAYVYGRGFWFPASAFNAPKEIELTDGERQLIASNNDFALRLFRQARGNTSSIVSPLSITYALGMMNNGAAGQTQQEINETLGFGEAGADGINAFCQKMLAESGMLDEKTKALISNTIFVNEGKGCRLQDGFIAKANEFYDAQPQNRDFFDGETMNAINQWANDHTEGMIPQVFDEDSFNPWAVSYLLNALYFKGMWSKPFDVADTKEEAFGGGPVVPMMHKEQTEFEYAENDLYQAIVLPYGNGAYQMSVFLPREDKTIGNVLDALNGNNWQVKGYHYEVDLKLPRFETKNGINLVKVMSDLGMPTAFTFDAEFPYFCNRGVYISNMFQVAKIKLDEQGTEAAAVTVIEATEGIPQTVTFHATRPFLYVISEQSTGAIFFIGQYTGGVTTDLTSDIVATKTQPKPTTEFYNLSGQRLNAAPARGLYIKNGKVVVR